MALLPQFRPERCVRYRYRYSGCERCQLACPHEAISLSEEGAAVDPARCQGCALCQAACPTEAWSGALLPCIDLLKQAAGKERFVFACMPSQYTADAQVPCLGALDPSMLAYLAARGVAVELKGADHCGNCAHGERGEALLSLSMEMVERLGNALQGEGWSLPTRRMAEDKEISAASIDSGRRQWFRRFAGHAAAAVLDAQAPPPIKAVRVAAPCSTVRRELLQAIWPEQPAGELSGDSILPLAMLRLSKGCNECEACARVCPTAALSVQEGNSRWELRFRFERCVGCGVCLEVCQPAVLSFADPLPLVSFTGKQGRLLHAVTKRRCARCDRFFITVGTESLCPICQGDGDDLAAIFG